MIRYKTKAFDYAINTIIFGPSRPPNEVVFYLPSMIFGQGVRSADRSSPSNIEALNKAENAICCKHKTKRTCEEDHKAKSALANYRLQMRTTTISTLFYFASMNCPRVSILRCSIVQKGTLTRWVSNA